MCEDKFNANGVAYGVSWRLEHLLGLADDAGRVATKDRTYSVKGLDRNGIHDLEQTIAKDMYDDIMSSEDVVKGLGDVYGASVFVESVDDERIRVFAFVHARGRQEKSTKE